MECLIQSPAFNCVKMAWVAGAGTTSITRLRTDWRVLASTLAKMSQAGRRKSEKAVLAWWCSSTLMSLYLVAMQAVCDFLNFTCPFEQPEVLET